MTVFELEKALFSLYDRSLAFEYDNVGLLVGDGREEISGVVVSLDCTDSQIKMAEETNSNVIVTHHPVIFEGLKSVLSDSLVYSLINKGISVISMHTNLDSAVGGVNDCLAKVLGLRNIKGICPIGNGFMFRTGDLPLKMSADEVANLIKDKLNTHVKYSDCGKKIKTLALCSGSGSSFLYDIAKEGADGYITAEVKHHHFYEAKRLGISVFDGGHFPTEDVVVDVLAEEIKKILCKPIYTSHESEIKCI